jgi:hypothetical protein
MRFDKFTLKAQQTFSVLFAVVVALLAGCAQRDGKPLFPLGRAGIVLDEQGHYTDHRAERREEVLRILEGLAEKQGLDPKEYTRWAPLAAEAAAFEVPAPHGRFIVVAQTFLGITVPGYAGVHLVLLTADGRILDQFECGINSRYGDVRADILDAPEKDGAEIIVRFMGRWFGQYRGVSHNWHRIRHGGTKKTFWVGEATKLPSKWNKQGLARLSINDKGFKLLFPDMSPKEETK